MLSGFPQEVMMPRIMWKPWVLNPIWHALLTWAITLFCVILLAGDPAPSNFAGFVAVFVLFGVGAFAIATVVVSVATYPTAERFIARLLLLYLALMLVYANFYFWMVILLDQSKLFEGIHLPWTWLGGLSGCR